LEAEHVHIRARKGVWKEQCVKEERGGGNAMTFVYCASIKEKKENSEKAMQNGRLARKRGGETIDLPFAKKT